MSTVLENLPKIPQLKSIQEKSLKILAYQNMKRYLSGPQSHSSDGSKTPLPHIGKTVAGSSSGGDCMHECQGKLSTRAWAEQSLS